MLRKTPDSTAAARLNTGLLAISALILLTTVGLSYREWGLYQIASGNANRTRDIVDSVSGLLASLAEAETAQRGFVFTGEALYLEPWNRATAAVPGELARLTRLLAGSRDPSELAPLGDLMDQELAELRQTIEVRLIQGITPAMRLIFVDRGAQLMERI